MNSLLVIGGSGFFGKSILHAYLKGLLSNWNISLIYIVSRQAENLKKTNPELISNSIILINADILICKDLPYADFVIHAASSTDEKNYIIRPEEELNNIILGADNYCKIAKKKHANSKILYCSSGAVYGKQALNILKMPEEMNFSNEIDDKKQVYSIAKRFAENKVKELGVYGLKTSIARCYSFIGPYLPRDKHFAIGNFIADGLCGQAIRVKALNKVCRSYMYSDELVRWLMTIVANSNQICQVYNVGSDQEIEISDLALKIGNLFNLPIIKQTCGSEIIDRYIPSIENAKKNLGLNVKINLDKSIKLTIDQLLC